MSDHQRTRKAALVLAGITGVQIAEAVGVGEDLVSHVLAGRRLHMPEALKVMGYVSASTGKTIDELWPERSEVDSTPAQAG